MMRGRLLLVVSLALLCPIATPTRAEIYHFAPIVDTSGEAHRVAPQLSVEVSPAPSDDQVDFTFYNTGTVASSITDIYFEDGALLGIAGITNHPGTVEFAVGATPKNLPGGQNLVPPFREMTATDPPRYFAADSDSPVQPYGVNPGESVGILFTLQPNKTLDDVIAAISKGFTGPEPTTNTSLRIGLHVQAIGGASPGSDSASFIMTPVPAAVLLGMLGLGVAGLKLRKLV